MSTTTPNLGLTLPGYTDNSDIQVLDNDFTILDGAVGGGLGTAAPTHPVESDAAVAAAGSAITSLRTDAQLVAATAAAGTSLPAAAAAQGASTSLSRADHAHARELTVVNVAGNALAGTSEVLVQSLSIPASWLAVGSTFRISGYLQNTTGSAATISPRVRYGTAGTASDTLLFQLASAFSVGANAFGYFSFLVGLTAVGAAAHFSFAGSIQAGSATAGFSSGTVSTSVATTGATFLDLTGQNGTSGAVLIDGVVMEQVA